MNTTVSRFQLEGCQCRLKLDPRELQTLLDEEIRKKLDKNAKVLDKTNGTLVIDGRFSEIDEGNFALHFLLAFLGKAWIAGNMRATIDGQTIVDEPFRISKTFAAFTNGKGQLKGDIKFLADQVVKKTLKQVKAMAKA